MSGEAPLTYGDAGVSLEAADEVVRRISAAVESTHTKDVLGRLGGFSGLYTPSAGDPAIAAGCDGVGTKILLGAAAGRLHGLGIDLVAMSVNDVITTGARPGVLPGRDHLRADPARPDRGAGRGHRRRMPRRRLRAARRRDRGAPRHDGAGRVRHGRVRGRRRRAPRPDRRRPRQGRRCRDRPGLERPALERVLAGAATAGARRRLARRHPLRAGRGVAWPTRCWSRPASTPARCGC